MQVLDRLKMELSNQEYLDENQYIQYLVENNLSPKAEYDKKTMQKDLLFAVIDVLEAVANDIDLMTSISTEFSNIGQAYEFIEARIQQIKDKIAAIPDEDEDYNCFSLMYSRGNGTSRRTPGSQGCIETLTDEDIDYIVNT